MRRRFVAGLVVAAALVGACGGEPATLTGYERTPAPLVGEITLPDLSNGGEEFALRADDDGLLLVYFGYTNCPDYCPTTMVDVKLARNRLDDDLAARIDVAMVTVDPDRDIAVLPQYVAGFVADGHALATDDPTALARAADPFGVTYDITDGPDGEPEVAHTTSLYAVDDEGRLVLTWPFGTTIDQLATDLEILLERTEDA
jgi:protein SCO1/2